MLDCVVCKKRRSKLYYFTSFYIMLYDFMNCPAFVYINKLSIIKSRQSKYNQRDVYFLCIGSYVCFAFLGWTEFVLVVLDRPFFIWKTKKVVTDRVRQVVVLHSNDCTEICLGGLSIDRLRQVVVLQRRSFEQV